MKLNIGILYGGNSVEHEISILTALQVYKAIDKEKYNVELFYITKNNNIIVGSNLNDIDSYKKNTFKNIQEIFLYQRNNEVYYQSIDKRTKKPKSIDSFIVCVHGDNVENGVISSMLQFINASYTCSDNTSSALVQDKELTKIILNNHNINTLPYEIKYIDSSLNGPKYIPCIIKPCRLGSSIGINIVKEIENYENGLKNAFKFENKLIIEPLIENFQEFNCACFKYHNEYYISAVEEIKNQHEYLTYEDKYLSKKQTKQLPAVISLELTNKIKELTKEIYKIFSLNGIVRIDYIYKDEQLYVNEINNIPGSLSYYLYTKEGITFTKLLDYQIKESILNKQKRTFVQEEHQEVLDKRNLNNLKK